MLLSSKGQMKASSLPKSKMKRTKTKVYFKWVIEEITKDRASFDGFANGKGIIATRENFLKFLEMKQGREALVGVKNKEDVPEWPPISPPRQSLYPWPFLVAVCFSFSFSYHAFCILIFPLKQVKPRFH